MAYTKTTTTSYGQRLSGSLKGIATGFVMFIIGTITLFWNEGSFVKTQKSLQEAEGILVRVADVSEVDPALNGKLIHASAFADTKETLTDGLFGVNETAISISRKVEYYQYEEKFSSKTRDKIGGGQETVTTYTYVKKWTSRPVASEKFNDPSYKSANFVLTIVEEKTERANDVAFGGYRLPGFIIASIGGSAPANANLTPDELVQWEKVIAQSAVHDTTAKQMVHTSGNTVYFGKSPADPDIGDLRVTLTKVLPADISIIARVNGSTFGQYIAANGKTVSSVAMGTVSAESMFAGKHSSNKTWTWIFRFIGIILVIGGLKSIFNILPTLFKVLPFLGNIVQVGVGLVCSIVGFAWSIIIISISWLWYRPLIGIALLAVAVAAIWFLKSKGKKTTPNEEAGT